MPLRLGERNPGWKRGGCAAAAASRVEHAQLLGTAVSPFDSQQAAVSRSGERSGSGPCPRGFPHYPRCSPDCSRSPSELCERCCAVLARRGQITTRESWRLNAVRRRPSCSWNPMTLRTSCSRSRGSARDDGPASGGRRLGHRGGLRPRNAINPANLDHDDDEHQRSGIHGGSVGLSP